MKGTLQHFICTHLYLAPRLKIGVTIIPFPSYDVRECIKQSHYRPEQAQRVPGS
jgi:hypothetical protein